MSLITCLIVTSCSSSRRNQHEDELVQVDDAQIVSRDGGAAVVPTERVTTGIEGLVGCWDLTIGPYLPAVGLGADAQLIVPPTGLQFHAEPGGAWEAHGFELSVPADSTSGPLRTGFWQLVSRTRVNASLATPFTALMFSLTVETGRLEGHVEPRWDFGRQKQRAVITGTKRACPDAHGS